MTAAGAVVWTVLALGQQPPQTAPPPTGLIVGRVVDVASGRPVGGVIVSLNSGSGPALPVAGGPPPLPRAMTNANGQFVFRKLAKGSYSLTATRPGYVDGAYGRRRPGGMQAIVSLDDGQRVGDVAIPMWRHAAISGTLTDEAGEPLIGVQISAFLRRIVSGRRRIVPGPTATTDDRGVYRLTSLAPGDYLVAFVSRAASVPTATTELLRSPVLTDPKAREIMIERALVVGGGGSAPGIQVGGSTVDLPIGGAIAPAPDGGALFIYPTQFHPGVPSAARAAVVTLASGQERESIDFSLRPVKTFRVSGTLVGPDGPVPNAALRLVPAGDDTISEIDTSVTMTGAGGDFALVGVPPGQYAIKALRFPRPPLPTQSSTAMTQIQTGSSTIMTSMSGPTNPASPPPLPPVPDDPTTFADLPVAVGNGDVTDLLVTLQRGARVTGRLEFDGMRERPAPAALTRVTVTLDRADAMPPGLRATPPPGRADEAGAFKTYGFAAGRYVVRVTGALPGWSLRSVTSEGRDISESPIDLRSTDVANAVVTFTDRPTKLTGTARTANGNADADAVVIAFPADSNGWSDYGVSPRRLGVVHAGRDGTYAVDGLPPGEYLIAAIHEDAAPDWRDPRVLESLARDATQVRLGEGETRTQDVKTARGGVQ